jgi:hypothetical protein
MVTIQAKVVSYYNKHLDDDFISLIVKILGCLHHQVNNFLHQHANVTWSMKGFGGPFLLIIRSFYRQGLSMAFQRVQSLIVLHRQLTKKTSFRCVVLPSFLTISLHNSLYATSDRFRS